MLANKAAVSQQTAGPIPLFLASSAPGAAATSHPVLDELAEVAKDALRTLMRGALAGAGRHFTARAEKAQDETKRRELLDALHVLRLGAVAIQRSFSFELDRALDGSKPSAAALDAAQTQKEVTINRPWASVWKGFARQLDELAPKLMVPAAAARFAPERIWSAACASVHSAELPERTSALILELLDEGVIAHLDQIYRRMLERLEMRSLPGAAPVFPVAANTLRNIAEPVGAAAVSATLHLDPHTKALLVKLSQAGDPQSGERMGLQIGYSNAQLATDLLQSAHNEAGKDGMAVRDHAVVQRLALVGRLFGAIASDPRLPAGFRQGFEGLRFAVIKSALADSAFFGQRTHPLRTIAAELVQRGANAHLVGAATDSQLDLVLQQATVNFDLSAAFVRPVLASLRPLPSPAIEHFLAELHEDRRERDDWRQRRSREIARRMIESQLIGITLPSAISSFISERWSEVLARSLLEQGHGGAGWREAASCLDELLDYSSRSAEPGPLPEPLLRRLEAGMREAGLPVDLKLIPQRTPDPAPDAALAAPVCAPTPEPATAPAATAPGREDIPARLEPPNALLRSGRWFRVFDHRQQKSRWLQLEAYYPAQNSIAFAELDGANPLCMDVSQFLDDLRAGRAAPASRESEARPSAVEPEPQIRAA
jgi:hypothetical protein